MSVASDTISRWEEKSYLFTTNSTSSENAIVVAQKNLQSRCLIYKSFF